MVPTPDPSAESGCDRHTGPGDTATFYMQSTGAVRFATVANGAVFEVTDNDKLMRTFTLANTGAYRHYRWIDWGVPTGIHRMDISVISGSLRLDLIRLTVGPDLGSPTLVDAASYENRDSMVGYGDSLALGHSAMGPDGSSDGFIDRLADARNVRLSNLAIGGWSAVCEGKLPANLDRVVARNPDRIIITLGGNDMTKPKCQPIATESQFRTALRTIITTLQARLPGTAVYLSSNFSTKPAFQSKLPIFNGITADEANLHGLLYVNGGAVLNIGTDFRDWSHPNNRGAEKLSLLWQSSVPWERTDLGIAVVASTLPSSTVGSFDHTYAFSVSNSGPSSATNVAVTVPLPSGTTFVSASSGCQKVGNDVVCKLGTMAVGAAPSVSIKLRNTSALAPSVTGRVAAWQSDLARANNSVTS